MIDDGTVFRLGDNNFRWIGGNDLSGLWLREQAEKRGLDAWVKTSTEQLGEHCIARPEESGDPGAHPVDGSHLADHRRTRLVPVLGCATSRLSRHRAWSCPGPGIRGNSDLSSSATPKTRRSSSKPSCRQGSRTKSARSGWGRSTWSVSRQGSCLPVASSPTRSIRSNQGSGLRCRSSRKPTTLSVAKRSNDARHTRCGSLSDSISRASSCHPRVIVCGSDARRWGEITSAVRSPILGKVIALCRMDVTHATLGTEVEVGQLDGHQKRIPARVVTYPHFDPQKRRVRGDYQ